MAAVAEDHAPLPYPAAAAVASAAEGIAMPP
jgi:hypothetical protein